MDWIRAQKTKRRKQYSDLFTSNGNTVSYFILSLAILLQSMARYQFYRLHDKPNSFNIIKNLNLDTLITFFFKLRNDHLYCSLFFWFVCLFLSMCLVLLKGHNWWCLLCSFLCLRFFLCYKTNIKLYASFSFINTLTFIVPSNNSG